MSSLNGSTSLLTAYTNCLANAGRMTWRTSVHNTPGRVVGLALVMRAHTARKSSEVDRAISMISSLVIYLTVIRSTISRLMTGAPTRNPSASMLA
jgi:hypothetical protein